MGYYEAGRLLPAGHIVDIGDKKLSSKTIDKIVLDLLPDKAARRRRAAKKKKKKFPRKPFYMYMSGEDGRVTIFIYKGRTPEISYKQYDQENITTNTFRAVRRASMARRLK